MVGERNFEMILRVKHLFDPEGIFNPGKITDTPPMNTFLRHETGHLSPGFNTYFNYSREGGFIQLIEKCNGSGDCRKTEITGGTMCPSYMATRDEMATTRARANVLRELLTRGDMKNPFNQPEIYEVLDLCLSCKACKSECPSSVDMAKIKAEFMQHWYDHHRIPLRTWLIANISRINRLGMLSPGIFNWFATSNLTSSILKKVLGFNNQRSIPTLGKRSLRRWAAHHLEDLNSSLSGDAPEVILYVDEFTNYNDPALGITTIRLFNRLGIRMMIVDHPVSARTYISKGLLKKAKQIARSNVEKLSDVVSRERPLVGIEPSAILGFRDEFPDLVGKEMKERAESLSRHCLTVEEYLDTLFEKGLIDSSRFTKDKRELKLHGHCQQKAIASTESTRRVLSIPENYRVQEIPSGCCGMAGSFGYEQEHYDLSMKVGELILFPTVREADAETIVVAPGTSCRHQILEGTGRQPLHPVEVLYNALK
jgi:Fe-S oxidoreductase